MRSLAATISLKVSAILPSMPGLIARQPHRKVAGAHRLQGVQQLLQPEALAVQLAVGRLAGCWRCDGRVDGIGTLLKVHRGLLTELS